MVIEFLQKSREIAPEIAFGLCLEFYGGLRRGEVINQTLGTINAKRGDSLVVEIKDNRSILFPHLKDVSKEFPKRLNYLDAHMAMQTVLDNELLWEIYDEHFKTLELKLKRREIQNPVALFLDKNGNAMSGNVYERRFMKVKKALLKELKDKPSRANDYKLLNESRWATHIGRGIFTNFLFDMGLSITQIAIARGDRNILSAMEYVDTKVTLQSLKSAIEEIKHIPVEQMGVIERDNVLAHWKNGVLKRVR